MIIIIIQKQNHKEVPITNEKLFFFLCRYIWSGLLVVLGIYLNIYAKRNKLTFIECMDKLQRFCRSPLSSWSRNNRPHAKKELLLDV